jgi:hypothetical protein
MQLGILAKVAWIRNPDVPMGQPASGHLNCPCGNAPESRFNAANGDVICTCGTIYSYDGWVRTPAI